jgi:Protein of unknown function (DUF3551)
MRGAMLIMLAVGMVATAAPASAQTYDPKYAFCKKTNSDASSVDCYYNSMEECREAVRGMSADCVVNPFYAAAQQPAAPARAPGTSKSAQH